MGVCERPHRWRLTILTFEPDVDDPREADRIGAMIRSQREGGRLNTRAAPIVLLALLFACASTEPENSASSVAPEDASTAPIVDRCGAVDLFDAARRKVTPVVLFTEWSSVSSGPLTESEYNRLYRQELFFRTHMRRGVNTAINTAIDAEGDDRDQLNDLTDAGEALRNHFVWSPKPWRHPGGWAAEVNAFWARVLALKKAWGC